MCFNSFLPNFFRPALLSLAGAQVAQPTNLAEKAPGHIEVAEEAPGHIAAGLPYDPATPYASVLWSNTAEPSPDDVASMTSAGRAISYEDQRKNYRQKLTQVRTHPRHHRISPKEKDP